MWASVLASMHTMMATLYLPHFLRALGAKMGKESEVSFFTPMNCELMELGDGCFVADGCYVAEPLIGRGMFTMGSIKGKK